MLFITLIVASFVCFHQSTAQTNCSLEEKDLIFIIDDSGSISASDFLLIQEFVLNVTETFTISNVTVNVAVITFATFATVEFYLDDYSDDKAALTAAVMAIVQSNGATFTDEALALARTDVLDSARGDRPTADNVVILITDDMSSDPERTRNESDLLRPFAEIFAVAIDVDDESEILYVGDDPDGEYVFSLSSYSELAGIVDNVGLVTCDPCSPLCENDGICDRPNNVCMCPEDTTGSRCEFINACIRGSDNCLDDAICTSPMPPAFNCTCKSGLSGDGTTACDDIDECQLEMDNCSPFANCTNTFRSFTCTCLEGYVGNGDVCVPCGS